jgi:energy-coupling factor transport system substrate-specific component
MTAWSSKDISLTAMLAAVSAASRVPFAAIPSVQPCTFIIATTGYVFGWKKGLVVGMLTAFVSNMFLGTGPWTLFQMIAWGLVGVFFASLGRVFRRSNSRTAVFALAAFGFLWGYVFGFIMNLWYLTAFGFPLTVKSVIALQAASFWFDTMHAAANAGFFLIFGMRVIAILDRFRRRLFQN